MERIERKALIRLLGPSCYTTDDIVNVNYPIIVEAELCNILTNHAEISSSVVDQFTKSRFARLFSLTWFNPMDGYSYDPPREKCWELYEPSPFDAWNKLKESREVGAMPHTETIYR